MKMALSGAVIKTGRNKSGRLNGCLFYRRDIIIGGGKLNLVLLKLDYFYFIVTTTAVLMHFHSATSALIVLSAE